MFGRRLVRGDEVGIASPQVLRIDFPAARHQAIGEGERAEARVFARALEPEAEISQGQAGLGADAATQGHGMTFFFVG